MTSTTQYRQIMMVGVGEPPIRVALLHGLNEEERKAVTDALGGKASIYDDIYKDILTVKDSPLEAMNALGKLGYHVVTTTSYVTDSKKLIWMLVKTI